MLSQRQMKLDGIKQQIATWLSDESIAKDQALIKILTQVNDKLPTEMGDTKKLTSILADLEKLPIRTGIVFFENKSLRKYFQDKGKPVSIRDSSNDDVLSIPALQTHKDKVIKLYNDIYELAIVWRHSFPKNDDGHVMTQSIGEWQASMMIDTLTEDFMVDYKRNFTIDGVAAIPGKTTDQEITDRIHALVKSAHGYECKQVDEPVLIQWLLSSRGGQSNNNVIRQMLFNGELFGENYAPGVQNGKRLKDTNNWYVNAKGEICLDMVMEFPFLYNTDSGKTLYRNVKDENVVTSDPTLAEQPGEAAVSSLISLKATVTLTTQLGASNKHVTVRKVVPVVTALEMESYTDALTNPKKPFFSMGRR